MTGSSAADHEPGHVDAFVRKIIREIRFIAFDFDGVFTDNLVYVFEDGREAVRCNRSDGMGLSKLRDLGIGQTIISTETNAVVQARAKKLKIDCISGCDDKFAALSEVLSARGLTFDQAAFVGNDINDIACLAKVALPIIVADAHPDTLAYAKYRTRSLGGQGAVREICDLIENHS